MAYISALNVTLADRFRAYMADYSERSARARVYRTTVAELSNLTSRELADLGIHRSEIKRIAHEAAYKD